MNTFAIIFDVVFELTGLAISLVLVSGIFIWFVLGAIRTGRIPYSPRHMSLRLDYIDREENPTGFWFAFTSYCLLITVSLGITICICILLALKPG